MDKATWNTILLVAVPSIVALSLATLAVARPRRQVLAPFLSSLAVSTVIYLATIGGASSFHRAVVICTALAAGIALLFISIAPDRHRLGTVSWALLGVITPFVLFFLLLAAACAGHSECFG